jgi:hypothetical protein
MSIKDIKVWQVSLSFIIWIGTMFLPSTVNQDKLNTNFDYNKSRENFFYFLFHQVPFYCFILGLLLLISLFLIYRKIKFSVYFSFASLIFYISFLVIAFPSIIIFNHSLSGDTFGAQLSIFLTFYGAGYIIAVLLGLFAFLLLFLYALKMRNFQKEG